MRYTTALWAATALLALNATIQAETIFKEDFDASIYVEGAAIPTELGMISHGRWMFLGKSIYPGVVRYEDGSPCVALRVPPSESRNNAARIIGAFGHTNTEEAAVAEGIRLRLSFKCSGMLNDSFYIQVQGDEGKATASMGMSPDGRPTFSFGGKRTELPFILEQGRWYTVEFTMPAAPQTTSIYTAALYAKGEATPLAEKSGRMARSISEEKGKYRAFEVMHRVPGETLYVDDIEVETLN